MKLANYATRLAKNKDAKTLMGNFSYLIVLQIAGYVFPLITLPYLARVIGKEGFGLIAFATAIITWIQTITDWGFNYTATRDVARNRNDVTKVAKIFTDVTYSRLLLMCVSFVVLLVLTYLIPAFVEMRLLLMVVFLLIPGHILCPEWLFQGLERMKYITILNVITKAVSTGLIFVVIKNKEDYIYQPLLLSAGYVISGCIALYVIKKNFGITIGEFFWKDVKWTIKNSTDVFINTLAPNLYNSFSIILLGFYGGSIANGIFDAGSKFVSVFIQLFGVISRTFFPFLSRRMDKHAIYTRISIILAIVASLLLIALAPVLVNWVFSESFVDSVIVLRILSISILFYAISDIYGKNYLIQVSKERELRNVTLVSSLIGFALAFPLVSNYSYVGAAIVVCVTRGLLAIGSYFMYKNVK